ncbi:MAG: NADH-quinone oxidoreductase subunit J family protein [Actinomycetota bacterium]
MTLPLYQQIAFWLLAVVIAGSAVRVVTARNVIHAALYLVATLMSAGMLYIFLLAEFVAWVQVLVYVGAIVVLMLFGLMLTRAPIGTGNFDNDQRLLAAICAGAVFGVTSWILVEAFDTRKIILDVERPTTSANIGELIFSDFVLPFEVVSVLLLAALVGAVVIAKRDVDRSDR